MLYLDVSIFIVFLVFSNLEVTKVLLEVLHIHPERAVIFCLTEVTYLAGLVVPELRFVRPVALPFGSTPWISDLNEECVLSIGGCHRFCGDEGVSVTGDESELITEYLLLLGRYIIDACAHDPIFTVCILDHYAGIFNFAEGVVEGWRARQVSHGKIILTTDNPFKVTVDLSPCLLEEYTPKFVSVSLAESGSALIADNKVIDTDHLSNTVLDHPHGVDTLWAHFVGNEEFPDSIWPLSKDTHDGEEVAIAKATLLDICWLDLLEEDSEIALIIVEGGNIGRSDPLIVRPCLHPSSKFVVWAIPIPVETLALWWEFRVGPLVIATLVENVCKSLFFWFFVHFWK